MPQMLWCDLIHTPLHPMLSASPPSHPPPPLVVFPGITSKQTACIYISASGKAHIRQPGILCINFTCISIPSHSHSADSSVAALRLLAAVCQTWTTSNVPMQVARPLCPSDQVSPLTQRRAPGGAGDGYFWHTSCFTRWRVCNTQLRVT